MDLIEVSFSFLGLICVGIPILGIILLLIYVVKKSRANQPKHVLEKEKRELITKVRSKTNSLIDWQEDFIEQISNNIDYTYSKGYTMRFNGFINSLDGDKLIAYRRLDRGNFNTTTKIIAVSKGFEIYYSQENLDVSIFFHSTFLGKLIQDNIYDDKNELIGNLNRNNNNQAYYNIEFRKEKLAYVVKNTERRTALKNPFFEFRPTSGLEVDPFWENPVSMSNTLRLYRKLSDYEYKWILALALYENIYYGIDFTQ